VKIAHLDTGRSWRGGQVQILALLEGLAARGHRSLLLAPPAPLLERARAAGLAAQPWRCAGDLDLVARRHARRAIAAFEPDVIHAHSSHAQLPAVSSRGSRLTPVVVSRRVVKSIGVHLLSRWKYDTPVARYLCISGAVLESMRRSGVPDDRLALVPSGVDVDRLETIREQVAAAGRGTELRREIGAAESDVLVGTAAAMTAEKRGSLLLESMRTVFDRVPSARFVWIGDGRERERLAGAADRLGIADRVHWLGFRNDVHGLVAGLDLFVLASSGEGLGTAVLEAQALGVPVVVTDSGGVRDAVSDGVTGRIAPDRDLGEAIVEAIRDPAMRARWRDAARASVRSFDIPRMVDRTLEEYAWVHRATATRN
jgi:glycosyltransferase involved in cell wall biosynthesis